MNRADSEANIILRFQSEKDHSICFVDEENPSDETLRIFKSVHDKNNWTEWIDSSGKSDLPPDFYNDSEKLMMEVMRIDDHGFINESGKGVNKTLASENKTYQELQKIGIVDKFPNATFITIDTTDLPTDDDHNYQRYVDNFNRVVSGHGSKTKDYRNNHPDYKLIFFICDESSGYIECQSKNDSKFKDGNIIGESKPHLWFMDHNMLSVLEELDVDQVIWWTPYKLLRDDSLKIIDLPRVCVFDPKKDHLIQDYSKESMISSEK